MQKKTSDDSTHILSISVFIIMLIIIKITNEQPATDLLAVLTASLTIRSFAIYQDQKTAFWSALSYGLLTIAFIIHYLYKII